MEELCAVDGSIDWSNKTSGVNGPIIGSFWIQYSDTIWIELEFSKFASDQIGGATNFNGLYGDINQPHVLQQFDQTEER